MRTLALVAFLIAAGAGCQQARAPSTTAASSGAAEVAMTPTVAKIVFIDKENACHCTKKRVAGTWAALQAGLGTPATLPVERIHIDTEATKARPTRCSSRSWCPPGINVIDDRDAVIEMLHGEVTKEQVATVLNGK